MRKEIESRRGLAGSPAGREALRSRGVFLGVSFLLVAGCGSGEILREFFREPTPHEAYRLGLHEAGLAETALGRDWIRAAEAALSTPLVLDPPYREEGFFPPDDPTALGYRFPLRRGQRLVVRVEVEGPDPLLLFVDLFRLSPDPARAPALLKSWASQGPMEYEPSLNGDYLLRVQPELLRGGRFRVTLEREPSLAFPVAERTTRSIGSLFGVPRDGGRRVHHGVDIFAPRGTPVLAAAGAYVSAVDTTPLGGLVIWLRDQGRGQSLYYAHLDQQLVQTGARVRTGDTLGLVGNTGNARTTPPHLHFGIYRRGEGPLDPWDFLHRPPGETPAVEVELAGLGEWVRIRGEDIYLRSSPTRRAQVLQELPRHTALRALGASGSWYRVRLPDGSGGWVAGRLTEMAANPIRTERAAQGRSLHAAPLVGAPVMEELPHEMDLPVLGTFQDYLMVRSPGGRPGWLGAGGGR